MAEKQNDSQKSEPEKPQSESTEHKSDPTPIPAPAAEKTQDSKEKITESAVLLSIYNDLKEKYKDVYDSSIDTLNLADRVVALRALDKMSNKSPVIDKSAGANNPESGARAPDYTPPRTLAELNARSEYQKKFNNRSSMLRMRDEILK